MNKRIWWILILSVILIQSKLFAGGFDYGITTYEQVDDILIVNSLGDSTAVSTYGKLGTNDWIPENSVKNYLGLEGYTQANDFNPSITNSQFVNNYNIKPNEDYTKLQFAGLLGNPRELQDVYVLTKEYNRLNSEQQAVRMDNIDTSINNETINRINGNNSLQTNVNNVNTNSQNRDTTLQNNINNEALIRFNDDSLLNDKINTNNNKQTEWNQRQDSQIQNHENRIKKLEQTQYNVEGVLRVLDTKRTTWELYDTYNTRNNKMIAIGARITIKLGKSYTDRKIEELEKRIQAIEQ
jgi:hypothetical protein